MALLAIEDLRTYFFLDEGVLKAVDGISFAIEPGETVALVGESGCGKTIVALSLVDLVPPPGRIVGGRILFDGGDVLGMTPERKRQLRGRGIGLIFQEPGAALNPVLPVGGQIAEALRAHEPLSRREAEARSVRLLGDVGIPEPERRAKSYPFELSGGMRQRVGIAIATCAKPRLLVADEPTTALDVTVQAEILDLLRRIQAESGMAILLITHDLGVVAETAARVLVMYTGKIVEEAPVEALFRAPRHPYSRGLVDAVLALGAERDAPLRGIPGVVPDFRALPPGCTFLPRCPIGDPGCAAEFPPLEEAEPGRLCACWKA